MEYEPDNNQAYSYNANNGGNNGGKGRFIAAAAICAVLALCGSFLGGYFANISVTEAHTSQTPTQNVTVNATSHATTNAPDVYTTLSPEDKQKAYAITEVVEMVQDSVVEIITETEVKSGWARYTVPGAGSGVILTTDGYIVTNNHVIEAAKSITIKLRTGETYNAALVGTDEQEDIAVVKIDAVGLSPASLGNSDAIKVGQTAIVIGNPLGSLGGSVTDGIISALNREITIDDNIMTLLQTNAAINGGNSGGGLFNIYGELVGVVNAKSIGDNVEGLGYAIPINTAKRIITDIMECGYVRGKIDTGMEFVEILDSFTALQYRVNYLGVYVNAIAESSNAYKAGVRVADYIYKIDGKEITQIVDINSLLRSYAIGDEITVTVIRNKQEKDYTFVLQEYQPHDNIVVEPA